MSNIKMDRFIAPIVIFGIIGSAFFMSNDFASTDAGVLNPAYYPRIIIYISFILTLMLVVDELFRARKEKNNKKEAKLESAVNAIKEKQKEHKITFQFVSLVILYAFAMNYLGFLIATPLFLVNAMYLLRYRKMKVIFISSLSITAVIYFGFTYLLNVRFPSGIFM